MLPQASQRVLIVNLQLYDAISQKQYKLAQVTVEREYVIGCDLLNGVIFNDLEWFKVTLLFVGKYLKNDAFYIVQLQIIYLLVN